MHTQQWGGHGQQDPQTRCGGDEPIPQHEPAPPHPPGNRASGRRRRSGVAAGEGRRNRSIWGRSGRAWRRGDVAQGRSAHEQQPIPKGQHADHHRAANKQDGNGPRYLGFATVASYVVEAGGTPFPEPGDHQQRAVDSDAVPITAASEVVQSGQHRADCQAGEGDQNRQPGGAVAPEHGDAGSTRPQTRCNGRDRRGIAVPAPAPAAWRVGERARWQRFLI